MRKAASCSPNSDASQARDPRCTEEGREQAILRIVHVRCRASVHKITVLMSCCRHASRILLKGNCSQTGSLSGNIDKRGNIRICAMGLCLRHHGKTIAKGGILELYRG